MDAEERVRELEAELADCQRDLEQAQEELEWRIQTQEPVLVALYSDGFVEVYCRPVVDVRVCCVPPGDRWRQVMQRFEESLPWSHQEIFWPCHLRASRMPEKQDFTQRMDECVAELGVYAAREAAKQLRR